MRDWKEGRRVAGAAALLLVGLALALSACGGSGGGGTTVASTTSATAPASGTTTTHGSSKSSKGSANAPKHIKLGKVSPALRAAMTKQWRRGNRAGRRACAGLAAKTALAHVLALAKAADKRHRVAVRAGMIARAGQLPKSALHGRAAPAMAAALIASGMPIEQRAGAFAGCMAQLRRNG